MAVVTRDNCEIGQTFYVRVEDRRKGAVKGSTRVVSVRRNGATKVWKTRPTEFKIPCKDGLYAYLYITHDNAHEFFTVESEA
jgi:hypothetical protein